MRVALVAAVLVLASAAVAAPSGADRACRDAIGVVGLRATVRALQRLDSCHRARAGGAAECNVSRRAAVRVDLARIDTACASAPAARAAYPGGAPADALAALIDAEVVASGRRLQGELAFAPDARRLRCQRAIGRARMLVVRTALQAAAACQRAADAAGGALDALAAACLPAAPAAVARADAALAAACRRFDGASMGSCGAFPTCVVEEALASARGIAAAQYGAAPGVAAWFDLDADLAAAAHFFDLPYPSDLRLQADGTPDLRGYPAPPGNTLVANLKSIADRRPAFPAIPVVYLRFDGPLASQDPGQVIAATADAPILLLDVDPASPARGRLYPLVAATPPGDPYLPGNVLAVAPYPGIVLPAGRRYAVLVRRALGDASGAPLGVPLPLLQLAAGGTPPGARGAAAQASYADVWATLAMLGVGREEVAAATVFTVGDVVGALAAQAEALAARHPLAIEGLALDEVHPRFCELRGAIRYPQFQRGAPPFNTQGDFVLAADGLPVVQREELAPVVIALPRGPMPAGGYPLVQYFHGSGGLAAQVVDRGPVQVPEGEPEAGAGPADVLAARGIAAVGSAHPLNPERLPGATARAYLNLGNLAAYPYTFRQGTIEQRLLLDALGRLTIAPALLAGCDGLALPPGETALRLATESTVAMGQSMGGQYTNYVAAIDARVRAAIPTGSGGLFSLLVLVASLDEAIDTRALIGPVLLGTSVPLTPLHPGLALLETAWEWAEPIVFAPRLAVDPLPGHAARALYQPIGLADPDFPDPIYAAMALASGTQQAGEVLSPLVQQALAVGGRGGVLPYPVIQNQTSAGGEPYTGAVVQYDGDGVLSSHHIAFQLDAVKHQYGCFAQSVLTTGAGLVAAPFAACD